MFAKLMVSAGPDQGLTFPLKVGGTVQIGRSPAAAFRLTDPAVSRVHCEIEVGEAKVVLHNVSANGTFINSVKADEQPLKSGDVIRVGNSELRYLVGAEADAAGGDSLDVLVGERFEEYQIDNIIAQGASGVVFKATDLTNSRPIALKVLQPEFAQNEEDVDRFIRAMKTMIPVRHPYLIAIHGAGKTGPYCWIAMEYFEGDSLATLIKKGAGGQAFDWKNAYRIAVHIGRALEHASELAIVHRNVAPPNILFRSRDRIAKLGDLILAKALEGKLAQVVTRAGQVLGEVAYTAPERLQGGAPDSRSDLYGLGASLYALLTGKTPFSANTLHELMTQIKTAEPEAVKKAHPGIPDEFAAVVTKLLAKKPEDRYESPKKLVQELERLGEKLQVSAYF